MMRYSRVVMKLAECHCVQWKWNLVWKWLFQISPPLLAHRMVLKSQEKEANVEPSMAVDYLRSLAKTFQDAGDPATAFLPHQENVRTVVEFWGEYRKTAFEERCHFRHTGPVSSVTISTVMILITIYAITGETGRGQELVDRIVADCRRQWGSVDLRRLEIMRELTERLQGSKNSSVKKHDATDH